MKSNFLLALFGLASAICLMGRLLDAPLSITLDYVSKPLLMPLLYLYFRQSAHPKISIQQSLMEFVSMGFLFAWLGDVFLMVAHGDKNLFLMGLGAFLVMQLLYIRMYSHYSYDKSIIFKSKPHLALPSLILGIGFYILLFPNLGPVLKIAVSLYALALVSMTLGAVNRYQKSNSLSFWFVTIGAFSFMISDMMIGLKSFMPAYKNFPLAGFWIMLTYIGGQFLIVKGIIIQEQCNSQTIYQTEEHSLKK